MSARASGALATRASRPDAACSASHAPSRPPPSPSGSASGMAPGGRTPAELREGRACCGRRGRLRRAFPPILNGSATPAQARCGISAGSSISTAVCIPSRLLP